MTPDTMGRLDSATGSDAPNGDDSIVAEVRANREALFAAAGYDITELCRQLRVRQAEAGREDVTLPSKRPEAETHAA